MYLIHPNAFNEFSRFLLGMYYVWYSVYATVCPQSHLDPKQAFVRT